MSTLTEQAIERQRQQSVLSEAVDRFMHYDNKAWETLEGVASRVYGTGYEEDFARLLNELADFMYYEK